MALTSPSNLFSPDAGDGYALVTDLAAMQDSVQAALVAVPVLPVGGGISWWGTSDPASPGGGVEYAIPDGRALSRSTYSVLFALWDTTFGAGDGTTTFNMPNAKGRVQVGRDSADTDFDTMGETRGAKTHTLTAAEMPSHAHGLRNSPFNSFDSSGGQRVAGGDSNSVPGPETLRSGLIESTGGGDAHNNIQPSIVANTAVRIK